MDSIDRTPGIRPRPTLTRRLDATARAGFPAACTVILMLLCLTPFGFADQAQLLPATAYACVWFWSLFRPASMPPPLVFAIGLLLDLLGYLPLGVGVLGLLITHGLALRWRPVLVRQGFFVVWLAFVGIAAGGAALTWGMTCVLFFRLLAPGPAIFQCILTVAIYPAVAVLFVRAHRSLADPMQA